MMAPGVGDGAAGTIDVSVIVVSYRTRDLTLDCLRSLHRETRGLSFETFLVDNASGDGTAEAVRAEFPQVRLMALDENIGFARANNLAAERAAGEFILLLNPDTIVLDDAVGRMVSFARGHPEAGIFGGRTLNPDGTLNPGSCWGRPTLWSALCLASGLSAVFHGSRLFNPEAIGGWRRDTERFIDVVTGCLFLIRRADWNRMEGFDPDFFMYGEEFDFCLRAKREGIRCLFCPAATIVHYVGASEKDPADRNVKIHRAKARLYDRHWSRPAAWLGRLLLDLTTLRRVVVFRILSLLRPEFRLRYENSVRSWKRRGEWR
jgi:N-acetylglucosaminyl-diphospho-decaprenol L-rhamnosyltransferase